MVWLAAAGILVLIIVVVFVFMWRRDPKAGWTTGFFCRRCGGRHPQDLGDPGPCPRCGGMDYDIRKGPPLR